MILINATDNSNETNRTEVDLHTTLGISDGSSAGTILTIVILSFLSIFGWIFMSYAVFGRSEAYRIKPDDHFGMTPPLNSCPRSHRNETIPELHVI